MTKTAKVCVFPYSITHSKFIGTLEITCVITETKFEGEDEEYDGEITSIRHGEIELLPILSALDAIYEIKRVLDKKLHWLFKFKAEKQ